LVTGTVPVGESELVSCWQKDPRLFPIWVLLIGIYPAVHVAQTLALEQYTQFATLHWNIINAHCPAEFNEYRG